jgi:hypothetical protein
MEYRFATVKDVEHLAEWNRQLIEDEHKAILMEWDIKELRYPEHPDPELGGNAAMTAKELRRTLSSSGESADSIPGEVTR